MMRPHSVILVLSVCLSGLSGCRLDSGGETSPLQDLVAEYGCPSGLPPISAVFDTTLTATEVCALVAASVEKAAPLLAPGDSVAHVQVRLMTHVDSRDVVLQSWWMVTLAIPHAHRDVEVLFDVTTGAPEARFVPKTQ